MTEPCDRLHAYVDGELDGDETTAFEAHLVGCDACNDELPRLLALLTALDAAAAHQAAMPQGTQRLAVLPGGLDDDAPGPAAKRSRVRRPIWLTAGFAAVAAVAAVVAVVAWSPRHAPPVVASLDQDLAPRRMLAARLSYPGADRYRQLDNARGERVHEDISMAQLTRLEAAKDWHGLAVGALLAGDPERAARSFAKAPGSPAVDSDRAALELADGSSEALQRALASLDRALAATPNHAPALWNRALVLAGLNLPLAAARDLDRVSAIGEPGWADEAKLRAQSLRAEVAQRRTRWKTANEAGPRLLADGTPVPAELLAITGYMTIILYDAVRVAPSRARVEALLPMARTLDQAYRSDRLTSYVQRIAASDFRVRGPLTAVYRQIVAREPLADRVLDSFFKRLEQTATDDIRLGAIVRTGRVAAHLEDYRRLAAATEDPWFALIAEHETAKAELARGDVVGAERRLRDAIALARRERLGYRALQLESELETLHLRAGHLAQAHDEAQEAYREASAAGEVTLEMNLLNDLAAINQDRYAYGLTRAYLAEILERSASTAATGPGSFDDSSDCATRLYAYDSLANTSMLQLDPDRARDELSRAPSCAADPITQNALIVRTALVRTELYRFTHRDDDGRLARDSVAAVRAAPELSDAQRAVLAYLEGDLEIDGDRAAGERHLRDAIERAKRLTDDRDVQVKVRAYGLSLLALAAGRASEFAKVIDLLAEALDVRRPERCAIAIGVQGKRSVIAFADVRGELGGQYLATGPAAEPNVATLVPAAIVDRLRSCPHVAVLTRAPVLGAGRLLPPELAWSYLVRGTLADASPATAAGRRLVVANPELPARLKMPPLSPYSDEPGASDVQVLRGAEATPTRVSLAMRDATVIEFHTHGFIANDVSEASYLMLSPELDGQYELTARDVAQTKLAAAPLVILGACHAAASSRSLEGGMGLAEAFLRAGARGVVASPDAVQDLGARTFFAAVRDRVAHGAHPAEAVRDERVRRLSMSHDDAWVGGVVVFE